MLNDPRGKGVLYNLNGCALQCIPPAGKNIDL